MLRWALVVLAVAAMLPPAAAAKKHDRTRTPIRIKAPGPANATVAGFKLELVRVHKANASLALARAAAAGLPRDVTVYAVLAKQKRSDRVSGVLVAVNRADAVAAHDAARARRLTINLKHAAIPKGYRLRVRLNERDNVLDRHRPFSCGKYFKASDIAGAQKLAGPRLPGITIGTIIQSACASARGADKPYPTEAEFRVALNARSGIVTLVRDAQVPNQVDGTASFNYPIHGFAVVADAGHQFTGCAFAAGTCAISSTAHPGDYALFTATASPEPRDSQLAFALGISPSISSPLQFQFFGINEAHRRFGPLLTTGP